MLPNTCRAPASLATALAASRPVRRSTARGLAQRAGALLAVAAAGLVGCAWATCTALPAAPALDMAPVPARPQSNGLPEGWQHGAFMEIFVRAYADSDGDGKGDLRGLTAKLDYLKDLGVSGLWLMPVTASADHDHGYAGVDFRRIEADYGSLADFDALIAAAHARGIGVIIDYMINHSAAASPLFQASAAARSGPLRDWYVWQDTAPTGWSIWDRDPWVPHATGAYFATFGAAMPDFNLRHAATLSYHQDSLRFWLNRGLDGYRLDAVPHLIENNARDWNDQPESRALTREFQALIKSYPQRHVVCEATAEPKDYSAPEICGSAFAFGLESQLVKAARGEPEAVKRVARYFDAHKSSLPDAPALTTLGLFVSNHDGFAGRRLWDQVGGDTTLYKLTAATYLLLPGTPYIYYGEELGQAGAAGLTGDAQIRGPMSWTADPATGGFTTGTPFRPPASNVASHNAQSQASDPGGLLAHYKALIALRKALPSIARGSWLASTAEGATLSFQRRLGSEHTLVTYNYGLAPARLAVSGLPARARLQAVAAPPASAPALATLEANPQGQASVALPAQSFAVWRVMAASSAAPP